MSSWSQVMVTSMGSEASTATGSRWDRRATRSVTYEPSVVSRNSSIDVTGPLSCAIRTIQ